VIRDRLPRLNEHISLTLLVPVSSFNHFIKRSFAVRACPTSFSCGGETRKGITLRCRSAKLALSSIRWIPLDFGGGTTPRFFSPSVKYGQLKSLVMLGAVQIIAEMRWQVTFIEQCDDDHMLARTALRAMWRCFLSRELQALILLPPVKNNQRLASALNRPAYCDKTRGVSRSGSMEKETNSRSLSFIHCSWSFAISAVYNGQVSVQFV
jgi:hypothetical protein